MKTAQETIAIILSNVEVTLLIDFVGQTVKENNWVCDEWKVTITGPKHTFTLPYFTGTGHRQAGKPVNPESAGILYSLILDSSAADMTFKEWAADFGSDSDSIASKSVYRACRRTAANLRKVFDPEALQALQDALQDY